jgi:peroxiredoxin
MAKRGVLRFHFGMFGWCRHPGRGGWTMNRPRNTTVLGLIVAMLALVVPASTVAIGGEAPDFTLRDIDGQQVSLGDYIGEHIVVVHFWTACCGSGKAVMPHLKTLHEAYAEAGVIVLAVSVDLARNEAMVKGYARAGRYPFPVLLDQSTEVVTTYTPRKTVPFTVVIGKDGQIHATFETFSAGDEDRIRAAVVERIEAEVVPP